MESYEKLSAEEKREADDTILFAYRKPRTWAEAERWATKEASPGDRIKPGTFGFQSYEPTQCLRRELRATTSRVQSPGCGGERRFRRKSRADFDVLFLLSAEPYALGDE